MQDFEPVHLLKRLLHSAVTRIGVRPAKSGPIDLSKGPIVIAGLFRTGSGIGRSAQLHADNLIRAGLNPICVDLSEMFQQVDTPATHPLANFPDSPTGVLILHLNAPEMRAALWKLGMRSRPGWQVAGYWAWEFENAPPIWVRETRLLSELWTPSEFVANAFRGQTDIPVRVEPHNVAETMQGISANRPAFGLKEDDFVCLTMADGRSSLKRKNALGAVLAFLAAFPKGENGYERAHLVVKTRNLEADDRAPITQAIGDDPRISLINETLELSAQSRLMASCDVLISLHRSEGYGLAMAEALALEKQVVATRYSGGDDIKQHPRFHGIDYTMTEVGADKVYAQMENQNWAEPDLAQAAKVLRSLMSTD